jgi:HEAT repeat protein
MSELLEKRARIIRELEEAYLLKDRKLVVKFLKHEDPVIRIRALSVLEVIGTEEDVKDIGEVLLNDPDPIVRHEAAFVLGQLGFKSSMEYLKKAVESDENLIVRHEASVAIGVIGIQELRDFLEEVSKKDPSPEVRLSAEIALSNLYYLKRFPVNTEFAKMTGG